MTSNDCGFYQPRTRFLALLDDTTIAAVVRGRLH